MRAIFVLLSVLICVDVWASSLMYPELNVAPKASKRLKIEAILEKENNWTEHLPIQISALSTIVAASQLASADLKSGLNSDDKKQEEKLQSVYSMLGIGVGAFWLGATIYASKAYRPYADSYKTVAMIKGKKSIREELVKERMAEEELSSLKRMGRNIRWASTISNFLVSSMMGSVRVDTEESNSQLFANVSTLLSLTPLFFKYRWERVAEEQETYKKKIYAPVAYSPILVDPFSSSSRATGMNLVFVF